MKTVRANEIALKALRVRKQYLGVDPHTPICPYNLAEAMEMDVRFLNISTFEGMYISNDGLILISSSRPEGRKRFTCAHELGHHILGHGTVIDEIVDQAPDKEIEREADFFAGMLLMPRSTINLAAKRTGVKDISTISAVQAYVMSRYIGVSYEALLVQLSINLNLISSSLRKDLSRISVRSICKSLVPEFTGGDVHVVGEWWSGRAIDVVVGDHILSSTDIHFEGTTFSKPKVTKNGVLLKALSPGISRLSLPGADEWSAYSRVSKLNFEGMCQFRHEEEVE